MKDLNVQTWDTVYSEGRSLLVWPDESVVAFLNRNRNAFKRGIDIACGAGRHALLMAQYGIEAEGVDSSPAAIEFAQKRAASMGLENVRFHSELVQDLSLEDEGYDLIIVWGLIHYLTEEDQQLVLDKVYAALRPGGQFLLTLRSSDDTRAQDGKEVEKNRFLVDYFDGDTNAPKQTLMYFWDEAGVREKLSRFQSLSLGHRAIEAIGQLGKKSSHWLISAQK